MSSWRGFTLGRLGNVRGVTNIQTAESLLEETAWRFAGEPFLGETVKLLAAVSERDLDALLGMGDEDFSIIDVDPTGESPRSRVQPEWEPWFRRFFVLLDALQAKTHSEITAYRAIRTSEFGYSVVEFRQHVTGAGLVATFDCIATIVWKLTDDGWKEARWHCSVIDQRIAVDDHGEALAGMFDEPLVASASS